jgi:hypothetical protein
VKGKRIGPVNQDILINLIENKTLIGENLIWRKGYSDWSKVQDSELKEFLLTDTPPPLTGAGVDNSVIWILALVPLLRLIIEIIYAENYGKMSRTDSFFLAFILNLGLASWDHYKLENAGHKTANFGWVIFVPVYLWKRATLTKQSRTYFWIWIVLYILSAQGKS